MGCHNVRHFFDRRTLESWPEIPQLACFHPLAQLAFALHLSQFGCGRQSLSSFFLLEGIAMWTGIELLLVLLGAVLFGSALLALAMGYSKMELEGLEETQAHVDSFATEVAVHKSVEHVFASEEASKDADNIVIYLNEYLRQAQASAERFVSRPSVEGLQKEAHQRVLWH
jgi:uncharacterized membrane protein YgdD (TMEM256/DUF423 family)